MQNKQLPDIGVLEEQVAEIRERVGAGLTSSDPRASQLHEIEVRLIDARRGDAAAAHSAAAQIGPLLDAIERDSSSELLDAATKELNEAERWAREIVTKHGTSEDAGALEALVREGRGAAAGGTHRDVDYRKDRIISLASQVILRQPGFWVETFAELSAKAATSSDPVRAGALVQRGQSALNRQDIDELTEVVRGLWKLFPDSANPIQSFGIRE